MADPSDNPRGFFSSPPGQIVVALGLFVLGVAVLWGLLTLWPHARHGRPLLLVLLGPALVHLVALGFFLLGVIRWALHGSQGFGASTGAGALPDEFLPLLRSINDRLLISDTAKRIAYRDQDRQTLRSAIREDIEKGDFEAALALVTEMGQDYGYRREAEEFRDKILSARDQDVEHQIDEAITRLDEILDRFEWNRGLQEVAKIQRLFPDSPRVEGLQKHVHDARTRHKLDLERQFLEAAQKDDIELAMDLLKELDKYLTEAEAEPFRETARGVIGKKRQNLGVQFKMAVHDHEWTRAVTTGEQIIREFPNSKMANEVRSMLDLLRERAAGEQAARPRELS